MGIPGLYKVFFRGVKGLKKANTAIFKKKIRKGTIHYMLRAASITGLKA
jgi:hypothetical protein